MGTAFAAFSGAVASDLKNVHDGAFQIVGVGGHKNPVQVLELDIMFGRKNDPTRAQKIHACIIESDLYKFVLGMDVLVPHGAVVDTSRKLLKLLGTDGKPIWLPLRTKEELKNSPILRQLADWKK